MDDASILTGIRNGDVAAFEAIFRAYHPRLCSFALRYVNDPHIAQDVVQDLFLNLWQKRRRLEVRTSLRAYLFAALRNRLLNKSASLKVEQKWFQQGELEGLAIADAAPLSDTLLATGDTTTIVRAAVDSLPPGCRAVVRLRFEEDMSYAEIADALGIAPKTVENHLARARKLLRDRLPDVFT